MRVFVDTNILVRCSRGNAGEKTAAALDRGVVLSATSRNVDEFIGVLCAVFGLAEPEAFAEVARILRPFEIVDENDFEDFRDAALERLGKGGKPDWPSLAAAMAFDAAVWSEDRDYFGVGVPIWNTHNMQFAAGSSV